ncbi:MAG: hypothetical protein K8R59_02520 [Thermoanaerobaculales bacterium]|nr:hypothetical protein [Thermoanaerobaculales bacterium]
MKEIVAAQDRVVALLEELDKAFDTNPEAAAKTLSFLEVEIFDHIEYHIKELRVPFSQFLTSVYSSPCLSGGTMPDDSDEKYDEK